MYRGGIIPAGSVDGGVEVWSSETVVFFNVQGAGSFVAIVKCAVVPFVVRAQRYLLGRW